ncbi:MAG: hypothetical protein ACYSSJ_05515, partial [Planctomycetota bacterium]
MNTSHGWIKLYRCLLDDAVCQKSAYFHLWVVLLLRAAHKEHEFIFNNQIHTLKPGQLITGRNKLSKMTGIRESTIEDILRLLENAGKIRQQTDNAPTASRQHADTYKNEKNVKNEKKHRCDDLSSKELEIQQ